MQELRNFADLQRGCRWVETEMSSAAGWVGAAPSVDERLQLEASSCGLSAAAGQLMGLIAGVAQHWACNVD